MALRFQHGHLGHVGLGPDDTMAPGGGSRDLEHQHGHRMWSRPWASVKPLVGILSFCERGDLIVILTAIPVIKKRVAFSLKSSTIDDSVHSTLSQTHS